MPNMTLEYDKDTEELLEDLKLFFGVKTKTAVIRRSLALAKLAKRKANPEDKTVVMARSKATDADAETFALAG
ncbi:hypothetical protein [Ancylobacter sp.]|uniref:hypothetical protein n=1 Tax=Ancylobacter sp. TaxID=1872567 RepID=UPI003D10E88E